MTDFMKTTPAINKRTKPQHIKHASYAFLIQRACQLLCILLQGIEAVVSPELDRSLTTL